MTGKALALFHGRVSDSFPCSRILVALEAERRNRLCGLQGSFRKMKIVAYGTILISYRLMDEPVLEEGFMAVLGLSCPGKEQSGQDDEEYQDVKSRTAHPCMDITVMVVCQPED